MRQLLAFFLLLFLSYLLLFVAFYVLCMLFIINFLNGQCVIGSHVFTVIRTILSVVRLLHIFQ